MQFDRVGPLNDMQRLLQTLVNTAYVENKSHSMLTRHSSEAQPNVLDGANGLAVGRAQNGK